jgi:hypothetical protein
VKRHGFPPWSPASAPIWALVSGYSSPDRCDKPLAFLQAFTDDSAAETGDRRLFFAGYLNRTQDWALFSDAWAEELQTTPAIEYLKMTEANSLSGQFAKRKGWTEEKRDEKLRGLARVISHFDPISFQMSIDRDHFYRALKPVTPKGFNNPSFHCCIATVTSIVRFASGSKYRGKIEFIFDEQKEIEDEVDLFFWSMMTQIPRRAKKMIAGKPLFRNDKSLRPLQAADMLAWHIRREHEERISLPVAALVKGEYHVVSEIDNNMISSWADHDKKLPAIKSLQTKPQWRAFKTDFRRLRAAGIDPSTIKGPGIYYPKGTPLIVRIVERLRRLFRRPPSGHNPS